MKRRYKWNYTDVLHQHVGLMRCTSCGKPINFGEYRYRETEEAYLPQHRSCSSDDPKWAELDNQKMQRANHLQQLLEAAKAFRERWNVYDLDDLIEELEAA